MENSLKEWLAEKRQRVNQLLDEGDSQYHYVPTKDPIADKLKYRHHFSQSVQGRAITQLIKEVAERINGRFPFQIIVCDDYADYFKKLDSVNQITNFQFAHDWEGAWNPLEDPIVIVANREYVEIYAIDETWDLMDIESRINKK